MSRMMYSKFDFGGEGYCHVLRYEKGATVCCLHRLQEQPGLTSHPINTTRVFLFSYACLTLDQLSNFSKLGQISQEQSISR
jgi:hypothetical protein